MNRPENMCQPPEYPPEMFAEYFESAKKRALRTSQIESILGDDYDLDRLRELVEADRDGRCVVLPRKTVFELTWDAGPNCDMICPVNIAGKMVFNTFHAHQRENTALLVLGLDTNVIF